jgi:hypothetical protein
MRRERWLHLRNTNPLLIEVLCSIQVSESRVSGSATGCCEERTWKDAFPTIRCETSAVPHGTYRNYITFFQYIDRRSILERSPNASSTPALLVREHLGMTRVFELSPWTHTVLPSPMTVMKTAIPSRRSCVPTTGWTLKFTNPRWIYELDSAVR